MDKYISKVIVAIAIGLIAMACQQQSTTQNNDVEGRTAVRADTLTYTTESYRHASEHIMETSEVTDTTVFKASFPKFNDEDLNQIIRYAVTSSDTASIEEVANEFITEYDGHVDTYDYVHAWFIRKDIAVQHNTPSYVSLVSDGQSYTGGAHGNYYTRYIHYDTHEKQELVLSDWVSPERLNELTAIGERFFRIQEGLTPNQDLDNYFFDYGRFSLPDNFFMANDSLHFVYNIYEIRSYAEGQTTLSVPFDEIAHLLTEKALVIHEEITNKEILSR